jgi:hypothetical protein
MTLAVVAGALGNRPWNGGNAWTRLSWLLGLRRLGLDVRFAEQGGDADYARLVLDEFGIARADSVDEIAEADLLVNIGGHLPLEPPLDRIPAKVYFDDDPGYTQIWNAAGTGGARFEGHDFHYTVGQNVGRADCLVPAGDIEWRHLLPPTVLEEWPVTPGGGTRFTTVATWRGPYGRVEHEGRTYGLKLDEFRKVVALPRQSPAEFELALDIDPAEEGDLALLEENGWRVVEPREAAGTPDGFRSYVQGSAAEFSVAQGIYVETRSGWFSDRTARYLASGKPALVQDTGFGSALPTGEGLVVFRTLEEAVAGASEILDDYERHSAAARAIAAERLDSDTVLKRLLEDVL